MSATTLFNSTIFCLLAFSDWGDEKMLTFQKLLFEARRHGKGEINDRRTPQLS
jgi:hypothetical protein